MGSRPRGCPWAGAFVPTQPNCWSGVMKRSCAVLLVVRSNLQKVVLSCVSPLFILILEILHETTGVSNVIKPVGTPRR